MEHNLDDVHGTVCKIGDRKYMEALRDNGTVFMNTLDTFWNIEDGGLRGDKLDGIDEMSHGKRGEIRTPIGETIPVTITSWTLQTRTREPEKINLYCMYALRWDSDAPPVDPRVIEFGDTAIIFTDPNEFQKRLYSAAEKLNRDMHANLVTYVPMDYKGEVGLFRKTEPFAFQSEWRFACFDGPGSPLTLELGPLNDISKLIPSADLKSCLTING